MTYCSPPTPGRAGFEEERPDFYTLEAFLDIWYSSMFTNTEEKGSRRY